LFAGIQSKTNKENLNEIQFLKKREEEKEEVAEKEKK
jgi:hypothetical protein